MIKINCAAIDDDAAYEELVAKCQDNDLYQWVKRQAETYGYDQISDMIYVTKDGRVKYFNISSSDPQMPSLHWDEATRTHKISTAGFSGLSLDEFKELWVKYNKAWNFVEMLDKQNFDDFYHI